MKDYLFDFSEPGRAALHWALALAAILPLVMSAFLIVSILVTSS